MLWGVELETDDEGEDSVRVRDGALVLESGRRNEMLRILSNGDGCCRVRASTRSQPHDAPWVPTSSSSSSDNPTACLSSGSGSGELERLRDCRASDCRASDRSNSASMLSFGGMDCTRQPALICSPIAFEGRRVCRCQRVYAVVAAETVEVDRMGAVFHVGQKSETAIAEHAPWCIVPVG